MNHLLAVVLLSMYFLLMGSKSVFVDAQPQTPVWEYGPLPGTNPVQYGWYEDTAPSVGGNGPQTIVAGQSSAAQAVQNANQFSSAAASTQTKIASAETLRPLTTAESNSESAGIAVSLAASAGTSASATLATPTATLDSTSTAFASDEAAAAAAAMAGSTWAAATSAASSISSRQLVAPLSASTQTSAMLPQQQQQQQQTVTPTTLPQEKLTVLNVAQKDGSVNKVFYDEIAKLWKLSEN